jgi:hypothetical protein
MTPEKFSGNQLQKKTDDPLSPVIVDSCDRETKRRLYIDDMLILQPLNSIL